MAQKKYRLNNCAAICQVQSESVSISFGERFGSISKVKYQSGFTIYMVLVILSITAILLSISIIRVSSVRKSSSAEKCRFQARMLSESGIVRAEYFLSGGDNHSLDWETDNYTERVDDFGTIEIVNKKFGAYDFIESTGKRLDHKYKIQTLAGRDVPELLDPVITLSGHAGGLEIKDSSKLSGTVAMFHGTIRYYKSPIIIRASPSLPFDSVAIYKTVKRLDEQFVSMLTNQKSLTGNVSINNKFNTDKFPDTIVILGDLDISSTAVNNRIIAVSGKIVINDLTQIDRSILICEKCVIKNATIKRSLVYSQKKIEIYGGTHSSQFISSDSIIIGNKAEFLSYSLCVNYRSIYSDTCVSGGVYLDSNVKYRGIIISVMDSLAKRREWRSSIVLGNNADVNGMLITNQSIYLKGNHIRGHIWAQQIESSEMGVSYTNYLLNCTIEPADFNFPFPLFGPGPVKVVLER